MNSILGPNTSPKFVNPAAKAFCVGTPFVWSQRADEPDKDSLFYDFGTPLTGLCTTPAPMPFQPGYSRTQPMTTLNGITFNNRTGTLRFTASQPEVVTINITVTEYRYNPPTGQWLVIGSSVRDLQVPIITGCAIAAQDGPQFASGSYPIQYVSADSLKGFGVTKITNDSIADTNNPGKFLKAVPVIDYACFDTLVNIRFKDGVYCESIDGTEFRIIGPDSNLRPVTRVYDKCRLDLVTKDIDLALHKALDVNGDYFLTIKRGLHDQNTLTNKCGFPLEPFFLVIIRVDNCPKLDYKLLNVSVDRDRHIDIEWEIDTSTFAPSLFTSWDILRANDNDQYNWIVSLHDVDLRSYKDTSIPVDAVDHTRWQYRVQLVQNTHFKPTNRIHSILLTDTVVEEEVTYSWTEYNGWDSAAYELEYGQFDTVAQQMNWVNYGGLSRLTWKISTSGLHVITTGTLPDCMLSG